MPSKFLEEPSNLVQRPPSLIKQIIPLLPNRRRRQVKPLMQLRHRSLPKKRTASPKNQRHKEQHRMHLLTPSLPPTTATCLLSIETSPLNSRGTKTSLIEQRHQSNRQR